METLKVSLVSYLNTKPFLYGLEHHPVQERLQISLDIPSEGARKLTAGEVDLGLIPVAAIPAVPEAEIISDYCIGTEGRVSSVCLFGEVPVEQMDYILLDYQSMTSVQLLRILCRDYWNVQPQLIKAEESYEKHIKGNTGGLVIGDRAISLLNSFTHTYDLGEEWKKLTRLPFVFAAWVARQKLPEDTIVQLNEALAYGLGHIDRVSEKYKAEWPATFDVQLYLTNNISYTLDKAKKEALKLFFQKINARQAVSFIP